MKLCFICYISLDLHVYISINGLSDGLVKTSKSNKNSGTLIINLK